jgi:hypothetical protein
MTPADRAAAIAAAKRKACAVVNCVAAKNARGVSLHLGGLPAEVAALVLVLAEAADPARLAAVCAAVDDGTPADQPRGAESDSERLERLRVARNTRDRLRAAGEPVEARTEADAREYARLRKRAQRGRARRTTASAA